MRLHSKQWEALQLSRGKPVCGYLGGIRSGKTIAGSHFALMMLVERPAELGGIFSNTYKQLTKATLKEFKGVLAAYGMFENEHYLVNKNPERIFGYKSKFTDHEGVWSWSHGAQIFTFSLETQIRGIELGYAWGDEIQEASIDSLHIVMGRMSGSMEPKTFYTLTPPAENPEIDEMIYGDRSIPLVIGTTYDNQKNLPPGYIEELEATFAPITFAREVLCERKPMSGLNWLYTFSRNRHVSKEAKYRENEIVYISFDFNVSPFVCILAHHGNMPGKRDGYIHVFAEVEINPDSVAGESTYFVAIAEALKLKIPLQFKHKAIIVTGDASGSNSHIMARVGENIWTALMSALGIGRSQLQISSSNPRLKDSRELCNAIFANHDEVLINPECTSLIRDCEFVKANPDGSIMKDNRKNVLQRADFMDVLRYYLQRFHGQYIKR